MKAKIIIKSKAGVYRNVYEGYIPGMGYIIDNLGDYYADRDKGLSSFIDDIEGYETTIHSIRNMLDFKEHCKKVIEDYKKRIAEVDSNLKAYYAGGKHCAEIEEELRDDLFTYKQLISDDYEENSYDINWAYCLKIAEDIITMLDFFTYNFNEEHYDDQADDIYIILQHD